MQFHQPNYCKSTISMFLCLSSFRTFIVISNMLLTRATLR